MHIVDLLILFFSKTGKNPKLRKMENFLHHPKTKLGLQTGNIHMYKASSFNFIFFVDYLNKCRCIRCSKNTTGRKCSAKSSIVEGKAGNNFSRRMSSMDTSKTHTKSFIHDLHNKGYEEDAEIDIIDLWTVTVSNGNMVSKCIVLDNLS